MADFSGPKTKLMPLLTVSPGGSGLVSASDSTAWFSPLTPLSPVAPQGTLPRQYAYPWGANFNWVPRNDEPVSFQVLRMVADNWDLLRINIERRKDMICGQDWEIRRKVHPGETQAATKAESIDDKKLHEINLFFQKPDGIRPFRDWLRMLLEEMYVIDAVAIYLQRDGVPKVAEKTEKLADGKALKRRQVTQSGKISRFMILAGDTINRCLDVQGLTPAPPTVAYQQVTYGSVSNDFTTDDLLYSMYNERANHRYGYSKVEQILNTITLGLSRQQFQREYYRSGNLPQGLVFVDPEQITPDQIKTYQDAFDARNAGNLASRSQMQFIPGGKDGKANVVFPKEVLLKDELDVWLAQVVCAGMGVSMTPFQKQMNRASAEEANDAAQTDSIEPDLRHIEDLCNALLAHMGLNDDYEFAYQQHRETDVLKQAQADNMLIGKVYTINEGREARGMDPRSEPEADMLGAFSTINGFIPLGVNPNEDDDAADAKDAGPGKNGKAGAKGGKTGNSAQGSGKDKAPKGKPKASKLVKATSPTIDPARPTRASRLASEAISKTVHKVFAAQANSIADKVREFKPTVKKAYNDEDRDQLLQDILVLEWADLAEDVGDDLADVAIDAGQNALDLLDVDVKAVINRTNSIAAGYAKDRGAEMVGKKWVDGELVDNPDAKWAISDTTREKLKAIIEQAFQDETSMSDLAGQIMGADIFSQTRAEMIAKTEVAMAQARGNLAGWKESGLVEEISWLLSADHDHDDECDEIAEGGPYTVEDLPDFPSHPNCECVLMASKIKGIN